MTKMNKKTKFLLLIIAIIIVTASLAVGVSYAIWANSKKDETEIDIPTEWDWEESQRYIIYVGLDSTGKMLDLSADNSLIASFAAVGYTGLLNEIVIPQEYTAGGVTKDVTAILVVPRDPADPSQWAAKKLFMGEKGDSYPYGQLPADFAHNPIIKKVTMRTHIPSTASTERNEIQEMAKNAFIGCPIQGTNPVVFVYVPITP